MCKSPMADNVPKYSAVLECGRKSDNEEGDRDRPSEAFKAGHDDWVFQWEEVSLLSLLRSHLDWSSAAVTAHTIMK